MGGGGWLKTSEYRHMGGGGLKLLKNRGMIFESFLTVIIVFLAVIAMLSMISLCVIAAYR